MQKGTLFLVTAPNKQVLGEMYKVTEIGKEVLLTKGGLLSISFHLTHFT